MRIDMCLAVPARIVEKEGDRAVADAMGNRWNIRITLTPEIEVGDVVLVHAGYAIAKVDEEEARRTWELFEEIAQFEEKRIAAEQADKEE
ncbi:MAG: HypC/HybG/HupF family hydrogenase formation chaperone [Planctomycetaceae bacterium]|nr:HypC/HybG/HupF family hydrogenase formation chaperone [Planctomycetaceae bacterium]